MNESYSLRMYYKVRIGMMYLTVMIRTKPITYLNQNCMPYMTTISLFILQKVGKINQNRG